MQQSPLWFGHMVHKDAPNTFCVFGGCGHGKSTLPENRPGPSVAFGQSDRPTLDVFVGPGGLGLTQGRTAVRMHHQHTAPSGRLGQQIVRARRILPPPTLHASRHTRWTGHLRGRCLFGRTGTPRQKHRACDGQAQTHCGGPRTKREMGVQHVENLTIVQSISLCWLLYPCYPVQAEISWLSRSCERSKKNPLRCRSGFFVF